MSVGGTLGTGGSTGVSSGGSGVSDPACIVGPGGTRGSSSFQGGSGGLDSGTGSPRLVNLLESFGLCQVTGMSSGSASVQNGKSDVGACQISPSAAMLSDQRSETTSFGSSGSRLFDSCAVSGSRFGGLFAVVLSDFFVS